MNKFGSNCIIIDTETTGLERKDKICSIATLKDDSYCYEFINEGLKISPKASSINNITNEMIKDAPSFKNSKNFQILSNLLKNDILVAHNASFEIELLSRSGFIYEGEFIDTLRVSKHLIEELESYSLNFLRYELKLYKKEKEYLQKLKIDKNICPHNALSDVIITKLLFDELLEYCDIEKMKELSLKPVLLSKFEFGKYSGRYIEEISMIDRGYLEWMVRLDDIDEDLRYTLEYYL
jgi:DNA polymerase-3 subunit epsilon/exodeoxyribonuclease X